MIVIQLKPGHLTAKSGQRLRFSILMLLVLTAVFACYFARFRTPLQESLALPAEQSEIVIPAGPYGVPYSLVPWNTNQSLVDNVRYDWQQRVTDYLPSGDIAPSWAPPKPIEISVELNNLPSSPIPWNTDKGLINDLPSNQHKIRFNDLP